MSGVNQTATTTVYVNNEAAKTALVEIEEKLKNIKTARQDAFEKGDLTAFDKLDKDVKKLEADGEKLKKKFFDVNGVLKDLSGASMRDLQTALGKANTELNKMRRDDPGWEAQRRRVEALKNAVNDAGAATKRGSENAGFFEKSWGKISSSIGTVIPVLGAAWGAIKSGEAIIKSAQATADEWEKSIAGLYNGFDYLKKSIATMDFSNFFSNLREAIKVGREYSQTLDNLADSNRALKIQEADAKRYILERQRILRDATKTEEERIKAADEVIAKEDELARKRTTNASTAFQAEIKRISSTSKLSQEELMYYMRNYDQLAANIKMGEAYNETLRVSKINASSVFSSAADASMLAGGMVKIAKEEIKGASSEQIKWGKIIAGMGKTADEELDKLVDLYASLQDADVSALENTQKVAARRSALISLLEKQDQKAIKGTTDNKKQAIQEAFDFEKFSYEMSSKEIKEWAEEAEKFYNDVFDAATKAGEALIPKPDSTIADRLTAEKEKLDSVLDKNKPDNLQTKIAGLNADQDTLEKNKGLIKEEEYQTSINNIKLKKGIEYAQAAQAITGALGDFVNAQQDADLAKMETAKAIELKAAGNNAEKKKEIEEKYGREELAIKKKYADKQFAAQVAQIVVSGALAIMQAFAQLGPIGGAIAAVLIGATTAMQVSSADQERKRVKALQSGGFTASSLSDSTPTDLVQYHANEFVANANAVRNPTVKPVLDVIDMAQRSGTIRSINLQSAVSRGFKEGGYTSTDAKKPDNTDANSSLNSLIATNVAVLKRLNTNIENGIIAKNIFDQQEISELKKKIDEFDTLKKDVKRNSESETEFFLKKNDIVKAAAFPLILSLFTNDEIPVYRR